MWAENPLADFERGQYPRFRRLLAYRPPRMGGRSRATERYPVCSPIGGPVAEALEWTGPAVVDGEIIERAAPAHPASETVPRRAVAAAGGGGAQTRRWSCSGMVERPQRT